MCIRIEPLCRNGGSSCMNAGRLCISDIGFRVEYRLAAERSYRKARSVELLENPASSWREVLREPWSLEVRLWVFRVVFLAPAQPVRGRHPDSRVGRIFVP